MAVGAFGIEKEDLRALLAEAAIGKAQLPEFQRGWVWPDRNIASLIASISLGYPVGTVMMLRTGGPVKFKERPVEGVAVNDGAQAERLILDGQQRLTSLYRALMHPGPVETRDVRKKPVTGWFYIDIDHALSDESLRDEAIKFVPEDKIVRAFGGEVVLDFSQPVHEYAKRVFPLNRVFEWHDWFQEYLMYWNHEPAETAKFMEFVKKVLDRFNKYQLPVIELPSETAREAVCQVFEKVNTGGVTLTVFELLTATYAADQFDLRQDWEQRRKAWSAPEHRVLAGVSNTDFLQIVALLATKRRREDFLKFSQDDERAPRIGCKRSDMLALSLEEYQEQAPRVAEGLLQVSKFLHQQSIFDARFLPYGAQVIPLAAVFAELGHEAFAHEAISRLAQWYWCGVFGELYGGTTETRFAFDLPELVAWVRGSQAVPRTVLEAQFVKQRLWTLRSRQSAAYKGLYAQLIARTPRDWLSGTAISDITYFDDSIDVHHIFPQAWCQQRGISKDDYNSILNKTPLSARTNRVIGASAPSVYIEALAKKAKTTAETVLDSIATHNVGVAHLLADDFTAHMQFREAELLQQVQAVMGKAAAAGGFFSDDADLDDSDE